MLFAPNKPNLPGRAGRDRGTGMWGVGQVNKQSQFRRGEHRPAGAEYAATGKMPVLLMGETPMLQTPCGVTTNEGDRAKQSQFRPNESTGKCFVENELWLIFHVSGLGKTKPIL